ncbi:hypothetical protein [Actinoplanes xinjiangensis]|uniref:hypothetical protein n=1 Tax=Actinoplanes xinjiangensis TaxID=512350 RepID=UPI00130DC6D4|nr:hypothetical protein [Actinoplanes xinjiangensis]
MGDEPAIGSGFSEGPTPGLGLGDGLAAEACEVDGCEPAVARPPSGRVGELLVTVVREPGPGVTVLCVAVPDRLPMPESIPASGRAGPGFVVAGPSDADRWVAGRDVGGWLVSNRVGSGVVCPGFAPPESGALAAAAPDLGVLVPVPPGLGAVEWEVLVVAAPGLGELTFEALVFVAPGFGGLMLEVLVLVAPVFIGLGCGALVFVAFGFGGLTFAVFVAFGFGGLTFAVFVAFGFGGLTFAVFVGFGFGGLTFAVFDFVGLTFAVFAALGLAGPGAGVPDLVGPAFIGSGG